MEWLLNRITTNNIVFDYKDRIENKKLFEKLSSLSVIEHTDNLDEIECPLCFETHTTQIRKNDDGLFIVCENGHGKKEIKSDELMLYTLNITIFLSLYIQSLVNTKNNVVETIPNLLWHLGYFTFNGNEIPLFYINNINELNYKPKSILNSLSTPILLYSDTPKIELPDNYIYIPINKTIKNITKKNIVLKGDLINHCIYKKLYKISFYNGGLFVNGELIYQATIGTIEYYFIELLWKNFQTPIAYDDIAKYCQNKIGNTEYADRSPNFCHKIKTAIKKNSTKKEFVEKIFNPTKNKNGLGAYIMRPI